MARIPGIGELVHHDGRRGQVVAVTLPPTQVGLSFDEHGGTEVDAWIPWPDEVTE